jgi:hypothetical protein
LSRSAISASKTLGIEKFQTLAAEMELFFQSAEIIGQRFFYVKKGKPKIMQGF